MRLLFVLMFLFLTLSAIGQETKAESEDAKLTACFKDYLDQEFRSRPLEASRLGDHRFDHLLDDVSSKARAGWVKRYRDTLADLPRKIDARKLSRGGQIDLEIFQHDLTYKLWDLENTNAFEED